MLKLKDIDHDVFNYVILSYLNCYDRYELLNKFESYIEFTFLDFDRKDLYNLYRLERDYCVSIENVISWKEIRSLLISNSPSEFFSVYLLKYVGNFFHKFLKVKYAIKNFIYDYEHENGNMYINFKCTLKNDEIFIYRHKV